MSANQSFIASSIARNSKNPAMALFLSGVAYIESSWNANENSGRYVGLYQISNSADDGIRPMPGASDNWIFNAAEATQAVADYFPRLRNSMAKKLGCNSNSITEVELYMGHLLGPSGGPHFVARMRRNPNACPTTDGSNYSPGGIWRAHATQGNWNVFFHRNGTPKTYAEINASFEKKLQAGKNLLCKYYPELAAYNVPSAAQQQKEKAERQRRAAEQAKHLEIEKERKIEAARQTRENNLQNHALREIKKAMPVSAGKGAQIDVVLDPKATGSKTPKRDKEGMDVIISSEDKKMQVYSLTVKAARLNFDALFSDPKGRLNKAGYEELRAAGYFKNLSAKDLEKMSNKKQSKLRVQMRAKFVRQTLQNFQEMHPDALPEKYRNHPARKPKVESKSKQKMPPKGNISPTNKARAREATIGVTPVTFANKSVNAKNIYGPMTHPVVPSTPQKPASLRPH